MAGRSPTEIWEDGMREGARRLDRGPAGLASTGVLGGLDVMLGVLALVLSTYALEEIVPASTAHILGSLTFGIAIAFITVGRSELFTENFLIPVVATFARGRPPWPLGRLWLITFLGNLVGLTALAAALAVDGVLEPGALKVAGELADTFGSRELLPALVSAIVAGIVMTLFTWLTLAAEQDSTRVLLSLLIGFILAAPSLNHAVVGFGEMAFGLFGGEAEIGWDDLVQNLGVAIAGNLIGGLGVVTLTRLVQVTGEDGPVADD